MSPRRLGYQGKILSVGGVQAALRAARERGLLGVAADAGRAVAALDLGDRLRMAGALWRQRFGVDPTLPIAPPLPPPVTAATVERLVPALAAPPSPRVSIIIPVFNHVEMTVGCLASLCRTAVETSCEVIVVDDASTDGTAELLRPVPGLKVLCNEQNLGFVGSCNRGARAARGELYCFLNNDTQVLPRWLDELCGTLEQDPRIGLVGAKLLYPDGRLQEAGGIVWRDGSGANYGRLADPDRPEFSYAREADYCSGACLLIPAALFRELRGFDERYAPAYYEDTDLAFRVRRTGRKVVYQPLARVVHFEGISCGTDPARGIKRHQADHREIFLATHRDVLAAHHHPPTVPARLAKDRGHPLRLLVVDTFIPQPDKDSGSLRMSHLLRLARQRGFQVSFLPEIHLRGSLRYYEALQRDGIEVLYWPFVGSPKQYLRSHGAELDAVILSRPDKAARYLAAVRRRAPRAVLVFDTVDLHFLREEREARLTGDEALAARAAARKQEELGAAHAADFTLVVSDAEQTLLAQTCPAARVRVLSNVHEEHPSRTGFAERRDLLFIGGFKHPPNIDGVRWFAGEVLPRIRKVLPEVRFVVVGSDPPPEIEALASDAVAVQGYVAELEPTLERSRVSVAPLRFGAGVKGKVNTAMSHGLPVVGTSTALEGIGVVPERDALIADDAERFADAVLRVYRDEALWRRLAEGGRRVIREQFSPARAAATIDEIYRAAAQRRGGAERATAAEGRAR